MINNIIDQLIKEISEAERIALEKSIKTNTVILNERFDFCKPFGVWLGQSQKVFNVPAMILGKHVITGDLPDDYPFALTYVDEQKYENELDMYKRRCEELEETLARIKEILPYEGE